MSTRGVDEKRGRLTCQSRSSAASPMDVDDLLSEILLRLAPLPSSLPRASLVCTRWRRLVTDPGFLHRFSTHHCKPLGVFFERGKDLSFSFLGPRCSTAAPELFSVRVPRECDEGGSGGEGGAGHNDCIWEFFGCRHGRVILASRRRYGYGTRQILVWNPVSGEDHLLGVSQFSDFNQTPYELHMQATVICASGHNGPFKLALAWQDGSSSAHICVYSSETGEWGNVVSKAILQQRFIVGRGNVMVGNTLYWILFGGGIRILEFDLDTQNLSVIEVPQVARDYDHCCIFMCTLAKGGGLSLMITSENLRGQLWVWEKATDGVFQWMLGGTIELDVLLSLRSEGQRSVNWLDGDDNVMFVSTYKGIFMVHLQSMQFEKIFETGPVDRWYIRPFKYLYAPGDISQQGDSDGVRGRGDVAGLKRADARVRWETGSPIW